MSPDVGRSDDQDTDGDDFEMSKGVGTDHAYPTARPTAPAIGDTQAPPTGQR